MKKKGFTLIELLAVVIILALVAIITVPIIGNVINNVRKKAFENTVYGLIDSANVYYATHMADMNEDSSYVFDFTNYGGKTSTGEELKYKGETPKGGTITLKGTGEVLVNDITDGTYYATKDTDESTVTVNEDESTLTRDELTERLVSLEQTVTEQQQMIEILNTKNVNLEKKVEDLEGSCADSTSMEGISTIVSGLQEESKNHITKTELDAVSTVANSKITKTDALDAAYPVGSIYVSTSLTTVDEVKAKLGGTWEVYGQGRVLVGKGNNGTTTYTAGATGGIESNSITLTEANLPAHVHAFTPAGIVISSFKGIRTTTESAGSHSHRLSSTQDAAAGSAKNRVIPGFTASGVASGVGMENAGAHTHYYTAAGTVESTFTGKARPTESTGSGTAFSTSTLQPYVVVYMYKRIS